jgi:hypothetical protein
MAPVEKLPPTQASGEGKIGNIVESVKPTCPDPSTLVEVFFCDGGMDAGISQKSRTNSFFVSYA